MIIVKRQVAKSYLMQGNWCTMVQYADTDQYTLGSYMKFKRMIPGPYWHPVYQTVELVLHKYTDKPYVAIHTEEESYNPNSKKTEIIKDHLLNTDHMIESEISAFVSLAQYMIYDNIVKISNDVEIAQKIKRDKKEAEEFECGFDCEIVVSYTPRLIELIRNLYVNSINV